MKRILLLSAPLLFAVLLAMNCALVLAQEPVDSSTVYKRISELQKTLKERGAHWTAGITSLSFLTDEQKQRLSGVILTPEMVEQWEKLPRLVAPKGATFPSRFDWRDGNKVTPVKNQLPAATCWAFAAVAALESKFLISYDLLTDISEQQAVDCTKWNCRGGWMTEAYDMWGSLGAVSEENLPYCCDSSFNCDDTSRCNNPSHTIMAIVDSFVTVDTSVNSIKQAVQNSPITAIMVACPDFFDYTSGCYEWDGESAPCGNHAVTIAGWDDTMCSGNGAWIVKNSYGTNWGQEGYFYIGYGPPMGRYAQLITLIYVPGDANNDGLVEIGDVICLINYLYRGGPTPTNMKAADANGDCAIDIGDVIYLISYLFETGPHPLAGCQTLGQ